MLLIALGALLTLLAIAGVVLMALVAAHTATRPPEAQRWIIETPRGIEDGVHIDAPSPSAAVDLLVKLRA